MHIHMTEKINYQLLTDQMIEKYCGGEQKKRLLLHACCAPCATYVLEYLSRYFDITVFFCNPNITDPAEYKKRLSELYRLCNEAEFCSGISVIEDDISSDAFFVSAKGLEKEPEGGRRCNECFRLRISRTAEYAKKFGYDLYATTLTVSPHKNAALINEIGFDEAEKQNIEYLPSDFKKRGGYQRSIELSKKYNIYRQQYCGCIFSMPKD